MLSQKLRFGFGKNWSGYLETLNSDKIQLAERSLLKALNKITMQDMHFLDIGSGSGLFSLAARRLGATVHSFDYDKNSVICTQKLKEQFFHNDPKWIIEEGSILDRTYIDSLGKYDVVYSWGVLHHTGDMKSAFSHAASLVKPEGYLFISIYNDQGNASRRWLYIKKMYNQSNGFMRSILIAYTFLRQWTITCVKDLFACGNPMRTWFQYHATRGMSPYYDLIDWVGGYPFEVATPEAVFDYFKAKDFELVALKTCSGGIGCNEFVFVKKDH